MCGLAHERLLVHGQFRSRRLSTRRAPLCVHCRLRRDQASARAAPAICAASAIAAVQHSARGKTGSATPRACSSRPVICLRGQQAFTRQVVARIGRGRMQGGARARA